MRDLSKFSGQGYDKGRSLPWQLAWHFTSHLLFQPFWVPSRLRVALLRMFGATVGQGVLIRSNVKIHWPWKLVVGENVWMGEGARILNLEQVVIGDSVCISQEAFICTGSHYVNSPTFEFDNAAIEIQSGAWVCARAMVLRGSTVAAGAVVPANTVYRG